MESVCDIAQDWLRSDKVYVEQIMMEIDKTKGKIKTLDSKYKLIRLEYDRLFTSLKQKQKDYEEFENKCEHVCKDLWVMESRKSKVDVEIAAVGRALKSCKQHITDMSPTESHDSVDGCTFSDEENQEIPGHAICETKRDFSNVQSSYKARLNHDAIVYAEKLNVLFHRRNALESRIEQNKKSLQEQENAEVHVHKLGRKVRSWGKKRARLSREIQSAKSHLETLEDLMKQRSHLGDTLGSRIASHTSSGNGVKCSFKIRNTKRASKPRKTSAKKIPKSKRRSAGNFVELFVNYLHTHRKEK